MRSVSFLILVDSFSLHHSIYFLQILYDTTGKLNGWCGGLKNKLVWENDHIYYYAEYHTRFQHLYLNVCKETKKRPTNSVPRRFKHLEFAFDLPLLSPFLISFLHFGIKIACHLSFFSFIFFFSFLYRVFLFLIHKDECIGESSMQKWNIINVV